MTFFFALYRKHFKFSRTAFFQWINFTFMVIFIFSYYYFTEWSRKLKQNKNLVGIMRRSENCVKYNYRNQHLLWLTLPALIRMGNDCELLNLNVDVISTRNVLISEILVHWIDMSVLFERTCWLIIKFVCYFIRLLFLSN